LGVDYGKSRRKEKVNIIFIKDFSVKRFLRFFGIIALIMVFGFIFAACDLTNPGGGGKGDESRPNVLIGSWGVDGNAIFILKADGSGSLLSSPAYSFTWSNSGHTLTLKHSGVNETVNWAISNSGKLSFSNQTGVLGTVLVSYTSPPLYPWEKQASVVKMPARMAIKPALLIFHILRLIPREELLPAIPAPAAR
jgi:hypothetical protein